MKPFHMNILNKGNENLIELSGSIDATAEFSSVLSLQTTILKFDLGGISLIDSVGVQAWSKFMKAIPTNISIVYLNTPVRIVNQMSLFKGFNGERATKIVSLFAPFYCSSCDESRDILLNSKFDVLSVIQNQGQSIDCPTCKSKQEFDGVIDKFFLFLKNGTYELSS